MTIPPIRLAFGATLWRIFAVVGFVLEIAKWHRLERLQMMRGTGFRIAALVLYSPKILFRAFLIAAVVTVLLDVYVRLIMRPILARWYNPRRRDDEMTTPLDFRLSARETILDELPARVVSGRIARPGTLVRTDRRIWFSPFAWDAEPWFDIVSELEAVYTIKAPTRFGSLIRGLPHHITLRCREGVETRFIVADPRAVLSWFRTDTEAEQDEYEPSPTELF